MYCGDKAILPPGYQGFDTRYNCLRRGVGVGKMLNCQRRQVPWYVFLIIGLLLLVIIFIALWFIFG